MDPKAPVEKGTKFCVCVKELIPWIVMPLQIAYVSQISQAVAGRPKGSFGFGSGTLHGHLLVFESELVTFVFFWRILVGINWSYFSRMCCGCMLGE